MAKCASNRPSAERETGSVLRLGQLVGALSMAGELLKELLGEGAAGQTGPRV